MYLLKKIWKYMNALKLNLCENYVDTYIKKIMSSSITISNS